MPWGHISIFVGADLHKATVDFYEAALKPIGYEKLATYRPDGGIVGFGLDKKSDFWIFAYDAGAPSPSKGVHLAFSSQDRESVDEFHAAGLGMGGKDNGLPGLRPRFHENYYAAFVIDPAGNNIEVVCHAASP